MTGPHCAVRRGSETYCKSAWWEHILHGQSAQFLKLALLLRPGFVVISVHYHEELEEVAPRVDDQ
jgi:hypothetical protein